MKVPGGYKGSSNSAQQGEQNFIPKLCKTEIYGTQKLAHGTPEECDRKPQEEKMTNVPLLDGAYCFNNRSGICKGFSGKFEFLFDTFKNRVIGPMPKYSDDMDDNGYHKRVHVSYNTKSEINYFDRSINWARQYKKRIGNKRLSLLSSNDFNWCGFVENDLWPYKSAIKYPAEDEGEYRIYFFNRQSCIYKYTHGVIRGRQHFGTRFLHNSSLRIDLDMNPTIFVMEDAIAVPHYDKRLVKHLRQHWYEVPFRVIENPTKSIRYFVKMSETEQEPSKINYTSGPLFTSHAYRNSPTPVYRTTFK